MTETPNPFDIIKSWRPKPLTRLQKIGIDLFTGAFLLALAVYCVVLFLVLFIHGPFLLLAAPLLCFLGYYTRMMNQAAKLDRDLYKDDTFEKS